MRVVGRVGRLFCAVALTGSIAASVSKPVHAQTGTRIVIRALTSDGQPVVDLKREEVTVRIDGRQREVKDLSLVRPSEAPSTAAPAATPATPSASALPPPYAITTAGASAGAGGGREILMVIDDDGIAPGRDQPVRDAVTALVRALTPADAVGVVALKSGGVRHAPTTNHAAALDVMTKIVAMGSPRESLSDLGCRTRTVFGALTGLLQNAPPSRTIVVFSAGMATPTADMTRTTLGSQGGDLCQIRQKDLEDLGKVAAMSPATVYVVHLPEALANQQNRSAAEGGLDNTASVLGAETIRLVGKTAAVERIAKTAGVYYVATLDGAAGDARRIEARVGRDGVRVLARPAGAATASAPASRATAAQIVGSSETHRDLPLRAAAFVSRQPASQDVTLMTLFEPDEAGAKLSSAAFGVFDQAGKVKAQWTAQAAEIGKGFPVMGAVPVPPGRYRIRVAATDANGKAGTVEFDFDAQLVDAAPLKTSHMMLGLGQGGFVPRLHFTSQDAAAIGMIEIYGVAKDAKLEVTFDIAKDAGSQPLGTGAGTIGAGRAEDIRTAYGGFGLAPVDPGDYVLRATISVDGKKAGVVSRTLRKVK